MGCSPYGRVLPLCHYATQYFLKHFVTVQTILPSKNLVVDLATDKFAGQKHQCNVDHYLTNDHYLMKLIFIQNVINLHSQKSMQVADEKLGIN